MNNRYLSSLLWSDKILSSLNAITRRKLNIFITDVQFHPKMNENFTPELEISIFTYEFTLIQRFEMITKT